VALVNAYLGSELKIEKRVECLGEHSHEGKGERRARTSLRLLWKNTKYLKNPSVPKLAPTAVARKNRR